MSTAIYTVNVVNETIISGGIAIADQESEVILATPTKVLIAQGNTQTIVVAGLLDFTTEVFWGASGSVSGTLIDPNGNNVPGCTNVILSYDSSFPFPGSFAGSFGSNTFYPELGTGYTLVLSGVQNGIYFTASIIAEVVVRSS